MWEFFSKCCFGEGSKHFLRYNKTIMKNERFHQNKHLFKKILSDFLGFFPTNKNDFLKKTPIYEHYELSRFK